VRRRDAVFRSRPVVGATFASIRVAACARLFSRAVLFRDRLNVVRQGVRKTGEQRQRRRRDEKGGVSKPIAPRLGNGHGFSLCGRKAARCPKIPLPAFGDDPANT
jgi:hypothetical protein